MSHPDIPVTPQEDEAFAFLAEGLKRLANNQPVEQARFNANRVKDDRALWSFYE